MNLLKESLEWPDDQVIDTFTNGYCLCLAYEIHKLTGWQLAIITDTPLMIRGGDDGYYAHVFCIHPNGLAIDINGLTKLEQLIKDWCWAGVSDFYIFRSTEEFLEEMSGWDTSLKHDTALYWAEWLVEKFGAQENSFC